MLRLDFDGWEDLEVVWKDSTRHIKHLREVYIKEYPRAKGGKSYKRVHASPDIYKKILPHGAHFDIKASNEMFVIVVSEDGLYVAGESGYIGGDAIGNAIVNRFGCNTFHAEVIGNAITCTPKED